MNFLYDKVAAAVASQSSVEDSLKHIESQQEAMGRTLDAYDAQTKSILNSNTQGRQLDLGPANRERDNRYVAKSPSTLHSLAKFPERERGPRWTYCSWSQSYVLLPPLAPAVLLGLLPATPRITDSFLRVFRLLCYIAAMDWRPHLTPNWTTSHSHSRA